jgi:lysozyme
MKKILSPAGLQLIKQFEGCRLTAYQDSAGIWTIGYGTTGSVDGQRICAGMELDEPTAERLLADALPVFEEDVNRLVTWAYLSQHHYDALISLVYNIGTTNFSHSTLLKQLNAGDVQSAADQFLLWCKLTDPRTKQKVTSPGLLRRRQAERALFLQ